MGDARALVAGLAVLLMCACGSVAQPAAAATPTKVYKGPSPLPPTTPSPEPPWVAPFETIFFSDRSDGWSVIESDADKAVEVVRTTDGGATWGAPVKVASLDVPPDDAIPRFGVRFANPNDGWVYGAGLFATLDGGATWTPTQITATVFDLAVAGSSVWEIDGCDDRITNPCPGAMFESTVGSLDWGPLANQPHLGSGPYQLVRIGAKVAYVAQEEQFATHLLRTLDAGAAWTSLPTPCNGYGMPVATLDGVHLWMACPGEPSAGNQGKSVYSSDDAGGHWTLRSDNEGTKSTGTIPIYGYVKWLAATSVSTAFLALDRGGLFRSTDAGRTWVDTGLSHGDAFFTALQFVDATHGWAAGENGDLSLDGRVALFRTTDGGATWRLVSSMAGTLP